MTALVQDQFRLVWNYSNEPRRGIWQPAV